MTELGRNQNSGGELNKGNEMERTATTDYKYCKVLKHLANSIIPLMYTSTKQDLTETSNSNSTNFTDAGSGQYTTLS